MEPEMTSKVMLKDVEKVVKLAYFHNAGDGFEREWWPLFKERFPNCEEFWRRFIVPITTRVDPADQRIGLREGVPEDLEKMSHLHYSVFLNLVYGFEHMLTSTSSSFEDFYMHLVSACDSAEEFLIRVYLMVLECREQPSEIFKHLTRDTFLKIAGDWYDKNYSKVYDDYLKKGKSVPIRIPARKDVLDEYFRGSNRWLEYREFSRQLREYRNVIVHDIPMGRILTGPRVVLVPQKEKIQSYRMLSHVFAAQKDVEKLRTDFINMQEQMILDIGRLEMLLDKLWDKPIGDFQTIWDNQNQVMLGKYNISGG